MKDEQSLGSEQAPRLIANHKIKGTSLYDLDGRAVAVVEDLVIDPAQGDVRYVLVLPHGGSELKPVPWEQLRFDGDAEGYVLSSSSDLLEKGSSADPAPVTDWTDESWNARVRSYYDDKGKD